MGFNNTGIFSYEEAKTYYKNIGDYKCNEDSDCPDNTQCLYTDFCYYQFICKDKDPSKCCDDRYSRQFLDDCKTDDDCLSNKCENNVCVGRYMEATVGKGFNIYGYETGEACVKDSECFEGNCKDGVCSKYDLSKDINRDLMKIGIGILIFIICCCYRKRIRKRRN